MSSADVWTSVWLILLGQHVISIQSKKNMWTWDLLRDYYEIFFSCLDWLCCRIRNQRWPIFIYNEGTSDWFSLKIKPTIRQQLDAVFQFWPEKWYRSATILTFCGNRKEASQLLLNKTNHHHHHVQHHSSFLSVLLEMLMHRPGHKHDLNTCMSYQQLTQPQALLNWPSGLKLMSNLSHSSGVRGGGWEWGGKCDNDIIY